ncbi:protein of unknown function [Taphrina deformans PYCC 5710]|uniref:Uncharacterized protein n=1 Tax=Taphrina deformans (strain PYCC 5710 / ATCC 11124 / CBS 356.35 / IMI 108563 / JCM 9778 / NBRC 8474) TaxID=1097556 RepID=R4XG60_TAPDE|nr:protein of unknown function [Taphrina deformans PYCC 5710]|eukprot:CCG84868.1 protein of unknown function [Taphrina deformans PYCC 5710]
MKSYDANGYPAYEFVGNHDDTPPQANGQPPERIWKQAQKIELPPAHFDSGREPSHKTELPPAHKNEMVSKRELPPAELPPAELPPAKAANDHVRPPKNGGKVPSAPPADEPTADDLYVYVSHSESELTGTPSEKRSPGLNPVNAEQETGADHVPGYPGDIWKREESATDSQPPTFTGPPKKPVISAGVKL